jgi:hypothetical protein
MWKSPKLKWIKNLINSRIEIILYTTKGNLNIPVEITLPFGYKQRFENGIDITQTKEDFIQTLDFNLIELRKNMSNKKTI